MNAIEFTTELNDSGMLSIPDDLAVNIPKSGRARVIVLTDFSEDDGDWKRGAYQQFLREDAPEDSVYDNYR